MKKLLTSLLISTLFLISPLSYSSVLSDKMSGTQSQTTNKTVKTDGTEVKTTTQPSEKPKETVVNNPKLDQFMDLSSSRVKLFVGILVIFGFFIYGFGRFFLTGKQ